MMKRALENPELISLAAGFVDQASLPVEATRSALLHTLADPDAARAALQYGSTGGSLELRKQLIEHVYNQDRAAAGGALAYRPAEDQVVLTAGSNQILMLLAEALLDPGDCILCDAPTYFVFTSMVQSVGGRCVGVAADEHGMRIDALEAELASYAARGELARIKAIYVMSYFDNPRGVSLAPERRAALVALAERYSRTHRIYVIEDAAYRELRYEGDDQLSLMAHDRGHQSVIYAGTFSKSFAPGLRVGFGMFPRELTRVVLALKANLDFGSPHLNQSLLSNALRHGLYEPHVQRLRALYARKAACMLAAMAAEIAPLAGCHYPHPKGGLYVWLELPPQVATGPDTVLFARACELGVLYVPGEYCFPEGSGETNPRARSSMRLSFGVQSEERIQAGIRNLAQAIREQLPG
ncbi:MAG: hypothetical protein RL701_5258 [Pseudomonadota bacterium]